MGTNGQLSGQNESQGEASKSPTKRNRPRLHITLKKINYDWIKNKTPNASKFIDEL